MLPTLIMWLLNGTIVAAVLARIFVFGEPITKPLSESSVRYWRHRKQADMDLAKVGGRYFLHAQSYIFIKNDCSHLTF